MTKEQKQELIKPENIKAAAEYRLSDLDAVESWFYGNESDETANFMSIPLRLASNFIRAITELYEELQTTGTIKLEDDLEEPEEEEEEEEEFDDYEEDEYDKFKALKLDE